MSGWSLYFLMKYQTFRLSVNEVLNLAMQNNPDIMRIRHLTLLNAQSNLAQAKASKGLNATLTASLGLNQQNNFLADAYT